MIGRGRILLIALVLGGGACAHTKTTDDGKSKGGENGATTQEAQETKRRAPEQNGNDGKGPDGRGSDLHPGKPEAVPVATAPELLLKPGAEDKIRDRLAAQGFLKDDEKGSMRGGIRRFQKEHDLPATGVVDHETVKALGLEPGEIFRQAAVKD